MANWKTITLVGLGTGAIVTAGFIYLPKLIKLSSISPELVAVPTAKLHKVDLTGITIRLDLVLKNPSKTDFKLKFPFIKLDYKGSNVGTSQSINQDIGLPGFGEAVISGIMVHIPLLNVFTTAGSLIKAAQAGETITMDVTTSTYIDPYWQYDTDSREWKRKSVLKNQDTLIPYKKSDSLTLKKGGV